MGTQQNETRFTTEDLAARAVEVLDAEGIGALTMRRMAAEMGVATTSSLYWRVRNKDDLLRLALDQAYAGALAGPELGLQTRCLRAVEALAAHPWALPLLAVHTPGPRQREFAEQLVAAFVDAGVPADRLGATTSAVSYFLIGAAVASAAPTDTDAPIPEPLRAWAAEGSTDPSHYVTSGLDLILRAALD